ncbi:hypothetical protein DENIS_2308 [Desulfonema ishimotonii]|uniref:Uncharacterized protein n=1 Tax=Desulfonema ishimotonii TaxID=45657 RepID=A0A401FWK2_9BACT|nr:hypothetical protein [Desulfonema ishimotonii]GBC61348.1 hypothetical protein DENIS_2308 [Desulfonema ishimotonii]
MPDTIWGQDLKLTDWNFGKDLTGTAGFRTDYALISGSENLAQALTLRLMTPKGSYTPLGHPSYGSRLYELIGELNNEKNRKIAEMYVREAVERESRVSSVLEIRAIQNSDRREVIDIHLSVRIIQETVPLNLVVPFSLEGG